MITPNARAGNAGDDRLRQLIEAEIVKAGGKITFARFMELALYAPELGYYTAKAALIGARGDFYTAPHLTPVFGQLIARQLAECWQRLGEPAAFQLVEMGAGQGLLASDILSEFYLNEPELWERLTYSIVERSPALREGQRRRLLAVPNGPALLSKVQWRDLDEFEPESVTGVFFSNELVDAFPVHLIQREKGEWQEIYLKSGLEEELGPLSTPALANYFELVGLDTSQFEDGYRTEINLAALDWMQKLGQVLNTGFVLTIDYGYEAAHRYHPRRRAGTLQTYNGHTKGDNPYINLGQQDITTHVDFTALMKAGEQAGLHTEGFTSQALFLAGLGLGERLAQLTSLPTGHGRNPQEVLTEYNALQTLINPTKMGNFGVLIQSKNVPSRPTPLAGLSLRI